MLRRRDCYAAAVRISYLAAVGRAAAACRLNRSGFVDDVVSCLAALTWFPHSDTIPKHNASQAKRRWPVKLRRLPRPCLSTRV